MHAYYVNGVYYYCVSYIMYNYKYVCIAMGISNFIQISVFGGIPVKKI